MFTYDDPPMDLLSVLLWPGIWFALAAVICYFAYKFEWDGKKAPWKWAALLPLLVGLIIGVSAFHLVRDPNYDQLGIGKKVTYALWATFILPLLGMAGFAFWQFWAKKQQDRY